MEDSMTTTSESGLCSAPLQVGRVRQRHGTTQPFAPPPGSRRLTAPPGRRLPLTLPSPAIHGAAPLEATHSSVRMRSQSMMVETRWAIANTVTPRSVRSCACSAASSWPLMEALACAAGGVGSERVESA
jgi:hypothetical protein